jgi:hypothetical protein
VGLEDLRDAHVVSLVVAQWGLVDVRVGDAIEPLVLEERDEVHAEMRFSGLDVRLRTALGLGASEAVTSARLADPAELAVGRPPSSVTQRP